MKEGQSYIYTLIQFCLLQMKIQYMFIIWIYLGYWTNHNSNMEWGKSWITCLRTCNKCQMWCSICTLCGWYTINGSGSDNFHVYSGGSKYIGVVASLGMMFMIVVLQMTSWLDHGYNGVGIHCHFYSNKSEVCFGE